MLKSLSLSITGDYDVCRVVLSIISLKNNTMIKRIFLLLFFVLVISQFLRPDKNQGSYDSIATFEAAAEAPVEVKTILQSNCYDCHSNTTRYPWFMEVSPITHWMSYQIDEGKEHFNVSEWDSYTDKQKDHKLEEFIEMIEKKEMPLKPYTWIHGELSGQNAETLVNWAKVVRSGIGKTEETPQTKEGDSLPIKESDSTAIEEVTAEE